MSMQNPFSPSRHSKADTPPNGDFAKYVEDLVAQQAKALSGGQQMTALPRAKAQNAKRAAKAPETTTGWATSVAAPVVPGESPGERIKQVFGADKLKALSGSGFKILPLWIYLGVILLMGGFAALDFGGGWPILILIWLFVLSRVVRTVLGKWTGRSLKAGPNESKFK